MRSCACLWTEGALLVLLRASRAFSISISISIRNAWKRFSMQVHRHASSRDMHACMHKIGMQFAMCLLS